MKKFYFLILVILLIPSVTVAEVITEEHWDSLPSTWHYQNFTNGEVESITCSSDPYCSSTPGPSKVLRIKHKVGLQAGHGAARAYFPVNVPTLLIQYWFKYSSNFQWEGTANKQLYLSNDVTNWSGTPPPNNIDIAQFTIRGSRQRPAMSIPGGGPSYYQNVFNIPEVNIQRDRWYKVKIYIHCNTKGTWNGGHNYTNSDGAFKMWIDDVLILDYTGVPIRRSSLFGGSDLIQNLDINPVWGGGGAQVVTAEQYLYIDDVILSTTPIGSDNNIPKIPSPPEKLSIQ